MFLGTSTYPADNEAVCMLIEGDGFKLLLDCCSGVIRQLRSLQLGVGQIGHIFVSHIHGDHVLGFPWLIDGLHLSKVGGIRTSSALVDSLSIYATSEVKERLFEITEIVFPAAVMEVPKLLELKFFDISRNLEIAISDRCKLIPIEVSHSVPCYGCKIETTNPRTRIVYSSDTRKSEEVAKAARGADLLIHEAFCDSSGAELAHRIGHTTALEAGEIAAAAQVKQLALIHISDTFVDRKVQILKEVREHFLGEVLIPNDGEIINF